MAKYNLLLPKMGESVAEATIIKWNKKPGDFIEIDEAVMEIATDKVDSDVPSPVSGRLIDQLFRENDVVQVGAVIAIIETDEHESSNSHPAEEPAYHPFVEDTAHVVEDHHDSYDNVTPIHDGIAHEQNTNFDSEINPEHNENVNIPYTDQLEYKSFDQPSSSFQGHLRFYSPLVRNIAATEGISNEEMDQIPGTGAEGRLTKDDLFAYIHLKQQRSASMRSTVIPESKTTEREYIVPAPSPQPEKVIADDKFIAAENDTPEIEHPQPANEAPPTTVREANFYYPEYQKPAAKLEPEVYEPIVEAPKPVIEEPKPIVEAPRPVADVPRSIPETPKAEPVVPKQEPKKDSQPIAPEAAKSVNTDSMGTRTTSGEDEIIEMDRMRRLIADHMVMSKQTSPHVTSFVEADVTNLFLWRERIKNSFEKREGEKITFTPIFIEAVVKAIKDFPMINISVSGTQITKKKDINISMATALPSGNLIVPVIKKADELNLIGLTKAVNDLASRARTNKLKPDDVQGGTFTITNVGSFGNVMGTPIINQPQVAILAVGAIKKKPAVIETLQGDMIGIRHMMFLSLSYDHRVVDGALGGSFLKRISDYLENWDTGRDI